MATARRTTTQRGLGNDHQALRRAALAALRDGDLCARCEVRGVEHPMTANLVTWKNGKPTSRWLDLDDFPGRYYGGPQVKRLSFRRCNRSHGGTLGNQVRNLKRRQVRPRNYDRW